MSSLKRALSTTLLILCLATVADAQQIRQPVSVLPWQAPHTQVAPAIEAPSNKAYSPAWLIEADKPAQRASVRRAIPLNLPGVETKSYAHIGQFEPGTVLSNPVAPLSPQNRLANTPSDRQDNLFRAIGFRNGQTRNR